MNDFFKIFIQYALPALISLIGVIYANKKSREIAKDEAQNKANEISNEYSTKMAEIEANYNTEIDKIKTESDKELDRIKLEYEQQDKVRENEEILEFMKGGYDIEEMGKAMKGLYALGEEFGIDMDEEIRKIKKETLTFMPRKLFTVGLPVLSYAGGRKLFLPTDK